MQDAPLLTIFIVRVTGVTPGRMVGTVEQVRTGERHRFDGVDMIGALVARLMSGAHAARTSTGPDLERRFSNGS
jgi:hypothetical protein